MTAPLSIEEPAGEPRGGIVLLQEAFGVNDHILDVGRRIADVGYVAVIPHLFHRTGDPILSYDDHDAARYQMDALSAEGILADIDTAIEQLANFGIGAERTGVVGFCLGGTIALVSAARRAVGAAVTFYGGGVDEGRCGFPPLVEEAQSLRAPWLGLFGDQDHSIPIEAVERLRTAAEQSGEATQVVRYPHAGHGFHCDARSHYEPGSAADAWRRTLDWFDRHLALASR